MGLSRRSAELQKGNCLSSVSNRLGDRGGANIHQQNSGIAESPISKLPSVILSESSHGKASATIFFCECVMPNWKSSRILLDGNAPWIALCAVVAGSGLGWWHCVHGRFAGCARSGGSRRASRWPSRGRRSRPAVAKSTMALHRLGPSPHSLHQTGRSGASGRSRRTGLPTRSGLSGTNRRIWLGDSRVPPRGVRAWEEAWRGSGPGPSGLRA